MNGTRSKWPWHRPRSTLPVNSDVELSRNVVGVSVLIRIRPSFLALAALGGALGTAARFGLVGAAPTWQTLSAGTVAVNLFGPYLLGALLQYLAMWPASKRRRALQLLIGVGFLGAFTSYAQLAVDVVTVAENSHVVLAGVYALGTIAGGAFAAWLGVATTSRWRRGARR